MAEFQFSLENYKDKIRAGVCSATDLSQMPDWVIRNTRHPRDDAKNWSFFEHEYQIHIMRSVAKKLVGRKCSQVGFSEFALRMALGLVNIQKNYTLIYVLPTAGFASDFTKGRIDPVILASRQLRSVRDRNVDSTHLKKFGNSLLYIKGSVGKTAGISVPAQGLLVDEKDFCDQEKLQLYHSRLGHAEERELVRQFSTPTVPDFGIDLDFMESTQAYYTVKCQACGNWVAPNPLHDIEVPGFDGDMISIERDDILNPRVQIHNAFLRCPHCRTPLEWTRMCNREYRRYIHKFPDREVEGYQVYPHDVPTVNPVGKTLSELLRFSKKDWVNMKLGLPYADADSTFLKSVIDANTHGNMLILPDQIPEKVLPVMYRTFVGIDMGKTCWLTVLQEVGDGGDLQLVYAERIRQTADDTEFKKRVMFICHWFGRACAIMDALPDISDALWFAGQGEHSLQHWGCHYQRSGKRSLENYELSEEKGIINAKRTESLTALCKAVNTGKITFRHGPEMETVRDHLCNLKRVDQPNEDEEVTQSWVKTGDDHFGHSLNYAYLAYLVAKDLMGKGPGVVMLPTITGARIQIAEPDRRSPLLSNRYPGIDKPLR